MTRVGRVLGTEDATPLDFWVAIEPDAYLQLDDVVALERTLPDGQEVRLYGLVTEVRARHEGARFDSDVFLIEEGILPAEVSRAARVVATRFEPEIFVPPLPGTAVRKAVDAERAEALFFDGMQDRLPVGLSRDDEPLYANLEFLDGSRGAHVNISGISGVATKTTYATFLLHSLFGSGALGQDALNTKAVIYNVKGEDLLFLDRANQKLSDEERTRYEALGLGAEPFSSVELWSPPRRGNANAVPDVATRYDGVRSFFWTVHQFCVDDLLPFLFADAEDDRQQYTIVIQNVMAQLRQADPAGDGGALIEGCEVRTFKDLAELIEARVTDEVTAQTWAGRAIGQGTISAFVRRLFGAVRHVEQMIRGDVAHPEQHRIRRQEQVTVIDIHNLNDRAKRFVVGVTLRKLFDEKERAGQSHPLQFVVLDELNKYAPREGSSPIKEILVDVSERGRSLGIILIGAQQTASEVERRIVANSSLRVVGRLDSAESARDEYGFLSAVHRQRATILKPGTMILSQPEIPIPLVTCFPFPAWATRASEAAPPATTATPAGSPADPFEGLV
ncbi:MAG: ATP-binding protein [Acidobacteria bacterium]|nr:ATP-binding protein [Acidobacteriota bacterium]MYK89780.1 ATP-binding protein [Acidobacteriota bacterium]